MSLRFFEANEEAFGSLDFAKDYLEKYPKENGKSFRIEEISLVRSGKGYLCRTDSFICWLWKRNNLTTQLLAALQVYVEGRYGYSLYAVLSKTDEKGVRYAIDPESPCMWFGTPKKYTVDPDIPILDVLTGNPFLIQPVPLTPTIDISNSGTQTQDNSTSPAGKTKSKS